MARCKIDASIFKNEMQQSNFDLNFDLQGSWKQRELPSDRKYILDFVSQNGIQLK